MSEVTYTAKDITVLEGLEPVRLRPGMYIGSTGSRGLHRDPRSRSSPNHIAWRGCLVCSLQHLYAREVLDSRGSPTIVAP